MIAPGRATSLWRHSLVRHGARGLAVVVAAGVLAACGASEKASGPPTLTWYVGPDRVDANALASTCTAEAAGDYTLQVKQLPTDVTARHATLVRRLAAGDDSIDLLSVDSASTAEFAGAGFFAPVSPASVAAYSQDIAPAALAAATFKDTLVVVPWFFDPQLLWFRGNTAERAGLDPTKPITWDDLVAGADRLGVTIQIQDRDGSGLSEWVDGLVAGSGGSIVSGTGRSSRVGLDSAAGRTAASVVEFYRAAGVGPGPSKDALTTFAAAEGGFLLAPSSAVSDPALAPVLADLGTAAYPTVGTESVAPLAGVGLAVPAGAKHRDLSYDAITCLTSPDVLKTLMTTTGHSASRLTTYDDTIVRSTFTAAALTKKAVQTGRAVPVTPYWQRVVTALDETWQPLSEVSQDATPAASQKAVRAAVAGRLR